MLEVLKSVSLKIVPLPAHCLTSYTRHQPTQGDDTPSFAVSWSLQKLEHYTSKRCALPWTARYWKDTARSCSCCKHSPRRQGCLYVQFISWTMNIHLPISCMIAFFMRKGADCLSKWVGEAERQLRLLFEEAKNQQPSIIFFIWYALEFRQGWRRMWVFIFHLWKSWILKCW